MLENVLRGSVLRVSFTGKDELDRMFIVVNQFQQTVEIGEQEIPAFVSSDPTCKADGQYVRREKLACVFVFVNCFKTSRFFDTCFFTNECDEQILERLM